MLHQLQIISQACATITSVMGEFIVMILPKKNGQRILKTSYKPVQYVIKLVPAFDMGSNSIILSVLRQQPLISKLDIKNPGSLEKYMVNVKTHIDNH